MAHDDEPETDQHALIELTERELERVVGGTDGIAGPPPPPRPQL